MLKQSLYLTGLIGLFSYVPVNAETSFSGYIETELQLYPQEAASDEQDDAIGSLATELDLYWATEDESQSIRFKPFARVTSAEDGNRTHGDIRELYYTYAGSGWQVEVGVNKVYWGVAEAAHLVDIINQTDLVEAFNGEEKLGQPMISFGLEQDWGNLDLYLLPYFREPSYADGSERFQYPFAINEDKTLYESDDEEKNIDYAARWSHYFGDLDIAFSYFSGTNREALPIVVDIFSDFSDISNPILQPTDFGAYFEQLDQVGLELQYILGDWALKFEGTQKTLETGDYSSIATGFEYTFSDVRFSGIDIGVLVEYLWNDRGEVDIQPASQIALEQILIDQNLQNASLPPAVAEQLILPGEYLSPMEDDIFIGTRFTMNDVDSTDFIAGFIIDNETSSTIASFEGSTRIGDSVRISLNVYAIANTDKDSSLYFNRNDDQIEVKLAWYF